MQVKAWFKMEQLYFPKTFILECCRRHLVNYFNQENKFWALSTKASLPSWVPMGVARATWSTPCCSCSATERRRFDPRKCLCSSTTPTLIPTFQAAPWQFISRWDHLNKHTKHPRNSAILFLFKEILDKGDDFELVPNTEFVVSRTAFKDSSSYYKVDNKKCHFKEVAKILRAKGIDLDHNRFLILQVKLAKKCGKYFHEND